MLIYPHCHGTSHYQSSSHLNPFVPHGTGAVLPVRGKSLRQLTEREDPPFYYRPALSQGLHTVKSRQQNSKRYDRVDQQRRLFQLKPAVFYCPFSTEYKNNGRKQNAKLQPCGFSSGISTLRVVFPRKSLSYLFSFCSGVFISLKRENNQWDSSVLKLHLLFEHLPIPIFQHFFNIGSTI